MKRQQLHYAKGTPLELGFSAEGYRVGQRVRLSELGIARSPKLIARTGTIAGLPGASTLDVLFDGNKRPTKLHRSYVELDQDGMTRRLLELGRKAID